MILKLNKGKDKPMLTLKFKMKGMDFELIGEYDDIVKFIQGFIVGSLEIDSLEKTSIKPSKTMPTIPKSTRELSLPSNEDVLAFITSIPNYHHTLYDVQKHFFGRTFITTNKETLGMYFKTMKQLKEVRMEIEKRYHGKFDKKRGKGRLDYYTFKQEERQTLT